MQFFMVRYLSRYRLDNLEMAKNKIANESIRLAESQISNGKVTKAQMAMKDDDIDSLLMS